MTPLYLLSVVFHVAAGCALSNYNNQHGEVYEGDSVLLPCSCTDPHTKPQKFTWESDRTRLLKEVFNDNHYSNRLHLFNNTSPGNLSLLITDLRKEDEVAYRCSTETEHRDIRIYIKGCDLSNNKNNNQHGEVYEGDSVLLPCSCTYPSTKPQKFTWESDRSGRLKEVFNDNHYSNRLHLFNNTSPGNLSLLITDLKKEDKGVYRCSIELQEYRDIRIHIKDRRKPDTKPSTEEPQIKSTKSETNPTSTTQKQEQPENQTTKSETLKQNDKIFPLVFGSVAAVLLVILGILALIYWRRRGKHCRNNQKTEEGPGCKGGQKDQAVADVTYSTVNHVETARAARYQIHAEEKTEYASIITN